MGLDIRAFKNVKETEPKYDDYGDLDYNKCFTPGASLEWAREHFPGRAKSLVPNKFYGWEGEYYDFRAGSYSGYNWWRTKLEVFANIYCEDGAFYELINFADNEGYFDSETSKKLLDDFAKNIDKAMVYANGFTENGEYWFKKYTEWSLALTLASENGVIQFF